jgi:hypothetical protein
MVGSIVQSPFTFFPISNFSSSPTSACRQASSSSTYDGNPRLLGTTDMPRAGPRGQARQRSQGLSLVAIASNAKVQFVEGTTPRHGGGKRCKIRCRENAHGVIEINSDQWRITCKYMLKYYISSSRLHDDHNMESCLIPHTKRLAQALQSDLASIHSAMFGQWLATGLLSRIRCPRLEMTYVSAFYLHSPEYGS